ncbi:MAG: anti-sigma factor antagonist [Ignavibacteria bacterium]|nr:MAG: anti-sigma factor antagonist [Ignavibacteria bacterium]
MNTVTTGIEISTKFVDEAGSIMQVDLKGYLDQSNTAILEKTIDDIYSSGCYNVIFNLESLHYISSAGWGVFVGEIARFRVAGGDFKIAAMNPEVAQVFMLLEFYHILEDYDSIDEAIRSFNSQDLSIKEEIPNDPSVKRKKIKINMHEFKELNNENGEKHNVVDEKNDVKKEVTPASQGSLTESSTSKISKKSMKRENGQKKKNDENVIQELLFVPRRPVPLKEMSIYGKIKSIIGQYPLLGIWKIKKMLQHEEFGNTKINIIKLYFILKELNLETKEKRYRYYRSI